MYVHLKVKTKYIVSVSFNLRLIDINKHVLIHSQKIGLNYFI